MPLVSILTFAAQLLPEDSTASGAADSARRADKSRDHHQQQARKARTSSHTLSLSIRIVIPRPLYLLTRSPNLALCFDRRRPHPLLSTGNRRSLGLILRGKSDLSKGFRSVRTPDRANGRGGIWLYSETSPLSHTSPRTRIDPNGRPPLPQPLVPQLPPGVPPLAPSPAS